MGQRTITTACFSDPLLHTAATQLHRLRIHARHPGRFWGCATIVVADAAAATATEPGTSIAARTTRATIAAKRQLRCVLHQPSPKRSQRWVLLAAAVEAISSNHCCLARHTAGNHCCCCRCRCCCQPCLTLLLLGKAACCTELPPLSVRSFLYARARTQWT